jgi:hypothetical protein
MVASLLVVLSTGSYDTRRRVAALTIVFFLLMSSSKQVSSRHVVVNDTSFVSRRECDSFRALFWTFGGHTARLNPSVGTVIRA